MIIEKIPVLGWIILLPLSLILFIGGIIFIFWALASIEGVASLIMLIVGFFSFGGAYNLSKNYQIIQNKIPKSDSLGKLFVAGGIVFFALMGVAIDQPGNYIYNKPLEIIYCPDDSSLYRGVIVSNPLPGRTDVTQNFVCRDKDENFVRHINMFEIIGVRFIEYIAIAYALIWVNRVIYLYKTRKNVKTT